MSTPALTTPAPKKAMFYTDEQAAEAAKWAREKGSATKKWMGDTASAGALATKNFVQAFYAKHKLDGVLLILITIIILVIAIVDISHATLSWDPKTPDDKARHRDRSITLMTFALLLVVFTIIKQFVPKLLGISPVPSVAAGSSM